MNSLYERSSKIAPGGVHSPVRAFKSVGGEPVFFKAAQGAYLTDVDGKTYIDFCQSFGPLILGHRDPEVSETVHRMIDTVWSLGAAEPYSLELAEWITSRLPWVEKLRFVSSGTEAVMSALRVARAATGRGKILKFEGCYHGHTDSMLVKAGSGLAGAVASDSAGVHSETAAQTLVTQLDDENGLEQVFKLHGKDIAAVIIEPLPANYGLLVQRKEFLLAVIEQAKRAGSLVIFDEVISGFRVALGGMAQFLNVRPDLVTFGKVIGGGFPVGCFGGRKELMDQVAPVGPVYQAGTLSANPVGMAAGLATLKRVEKLDLFTKLNHTGDQFCRKLSESFDSNELPLQITRFGSIFWIHLKSRDPIRTLSQIPNGHREKFPAFFHSALKRGVYLPPSGFEVCFLSNAHTEEVLALAHDRLIEAAKESYVKGSK
jgi:glutamate-1-semialdehyde 2,1-aminomutase